MQEYFTTHPISNILGCKADMQMKKRKSYAVPS